MKKCALNNFAALGHKEEKMWEPPLVGFASGDDPLFQFYKEEIGAFYMTPVEVFKTKYTDMDVKGEDLTVISLAFSQSAATKKAQARQKEEPCKRWMYSRNAWKPVVDELYAHISKVLAEHDIHFVIPDQMPQMKTMRSDKFGFASPWSQRHTAFIAGLGTFGLSDGLITKQGVAMRFTSLITDQKIRSDKREYKKHQEWCLFGRNGSCGTCIKRCPAGAITKNGHDKDKCKNYLDKIDKKFLQDPLFDQNGEVGCGLCQSATPCANCSPMNG